MTGFRLHVKAADLMNFARLETHISKFSFDLIRHSISVEENKSIQAEFEVRKEPKQHSLEFCPTPEITELFFEKLHKNAIQRDALESISNIVREGGAVLFGSDGRVFEPAASPEHPGKIIPDCSKPFRPQSLNFSDGRLFGTVEGEGPSTGITLSPECRIIAAKIAKNPIYLPRSLNKTLNGDHQQVFEAGALKAFLELLLESVNEIIRDELDY